MPSKSRLKVSSDDEQEYTSQVATSSKKGKRPRQVIDDEPQSDHAPPAKRLTSAVTKSKSHAGREDSESEGEEDVDVEGTNSDAAPSPRRQRSTSNARRDDDDDDVADTDSSRLSTPEPSPLRKHATAAKFEKSTRAKPNRIESDEEDSKTASPAPPQKPPRPPVRQDSTTSKPLRKPVTTVSKPKEKEKESSSGLSNIPSIPRRPKDALTAIKDTQDMDLLNKDVYNQLFNTSSSSKPIPKNAQTEAKQKEINAKRQAAKSALLKARESTFDLQLPTDKVLAFESRLRKLHRWYAPSALGYTYHEELRVRQRQTQGQIRPQS